METRTGITGKTSQLAYNPETRQLDAFRKPTKSDPWGRQHRYLEVSVEHWESLKHSVDVTRYINHYLVPSHVFQEIKISTGVVMSTTFPVASKVMVQSVSTEAERIQAIRDNAQARS